MNITISVKLGCGQKNSPKNTVICAENYFKRQLAFDCVRMEVRKSTTASVSKLELIKEHMKSSFSLQILIFCATCIDLP